MKALKNPEVLEKTRFGVNRLSTNELLSILTDIDTDNFQKAQESLLSDTNGNMICETLEVATYGELPQKITVTQSLKFQAIIELINRTKIAESRKVTQIRSPEDVAAYLKPLVKNKYKEQFIAIFLNTKGHIIKHEIITIGSLQASIVHPREIFESACRNHAASIIVAHNHPSGDPTPSREDIQVTQRLVKAGKIMDIPVLDHIIIGSDSNCRWKSLKERGDMA